VSATWGTEVSFRLGAGTAEGARAIAARLAAAAGGAQGHVLFLAEEAGEYGCLATWGSEEAAVRYAEEPAVRAVLGELAELTGREPRVRRYRMEHQPVPAGRGAHAGGPDGR
jgi:hypothetical protein